MNQCRLLRIIICLALSISFLSACSNPTPIPPTAVPTQVPSTATPIPRPTITPEPTQTPTAIILPTDTSVPSTPASDAARIPGGLILAKAKSQLMMYGQRAGTNEDAIHIVNARSFEEVDTQKGIQLTLSGGGPPLFTIFEDQKFTNQKGEVALVDMSIGATDDPNVFITVLWTSDFDGIFPAADSLSDHKELFSVQSGPSTEKDGWLELGRIMLSNNNLKPEEQQEDFSFILFHHSEELYILGFPSNYEMVLPPEDLKASVQNAHTGQEQKYLVKGYAGGTVLLPLGGMLSMPIPILQVNYIEKLK